MTVSDTAAKPPLIAVFVKVDPAGWRGLTGRTPGPPNRFALTENPVPKPGDQY
jgi:hypothetical protein